VRLHHATIATPLGEMFALASDRALCVLEFGTLARRGRLDARLQKWFPPHEIEDGESPIIACTRQWLARYFEGAGADASDMPLEMHGTAFERKVWHALLRIAPGETRSYGSMARDLGSAGASRAVGLANGANPLAIIVPCHRVIGSNGSLTGYGGGLDKKAWLLKHEARWRRELPLMDLMRDAQTRV
jgi:O-6-methylguanine DNA methyltransferase